MHMNTEERIRSLRELQILASPPEARFDRIIRILCRLFSAPIGFLGLVGKDSVCYKSQIGLPSLELPLYDSFCARAIEQEGLFVIADTKADRRFQSLSWVSGAPFVRFYASYPLLGPRGVRVGTLGLMDIQPREMSVEELGMLKDLGVWATREVNFPVLQQAKSRHVDSEVRMRAVLNNVQEGILTLSINGRIESCNPAAEKIFDFQANEVVGLNILKLLRIDSAERHIEARREGLLSTPSLSAMLGGEVTGRRKDGSTFSMELSLSEMHIGKRRMFTAIVRDITERKNAERQLQASEERYRELFENANDIIHITDDRGHFLYVNRAWRDALGYDDQDLSRLTLSDIIHPDERGQFDSFLGRILSGENVDNVESTYVTSQGFEINVEGSITGKDENGDVTAIRCIFHDVTERKKMEQMKKEFISVVSHELRTPLTSICGSLGLLVGGVVSRSSEQSDTMITIAYNNSQRLVRLINDILDIEKMEGGKMKFSMELVELMPLLALALEENRGYAEKHSVQFRITQAIEKAVVTADSDRLMQVMNNLLSNAAKFSPTGADIDVAVTTYRDSYRVSVIDRGKGIPEEFRSRVFAKFSQVDSSTTRRKGGTGLGLSICKHLIENMGGRIDYQSQLGTGTTFFFDLPIAKPCS